MSWTDKARISAAAQAVREIRDNTTIGLGSGNTILRALELAAERIKKENLKITFIPTSYQTEIAARDRKSTRLNSSHVRISYAVFCLKKKKKKYIVYGVERMGNSVGRSECASTV